MEIHDASHLWGEDVFETKQIIRTELKNKGLQILCIGLAGETALGEPKDIEHTESDIHPKHGRILLKLKDAPVFEAKDYAASKAKQIDEYRATQAKDMRTPGQPGHRARSTILMQP